MDTGDDDNQEFVIAMRRDNIYDMAVYHIEYGTPFWGPQNSRNGDN